MERQKKKKPIETIRIGRIQACIWRNLSKAGKPWYNVTVSRSYMLNHDDWYDSDSFSYSDLPCIGRALEDAMSWIRDQRAIDERNAIYAHAMDEGTKATSPSVGRKKRRSK